MPRKSWRSTTARSKSHRVSYLKKCANEGHHWTHLTSQSTSNSLLRRTWSAVWKKFNLSAHSIVLISAKSSSNRLLRTPSHLSRPSSSMRLDLKDLKLSKPNSSNTLTWPSRAIRNSSIIASRSQIAGSKPWSRVSNHSSKSVSWAQRLCSAMRDLIYKASKICQSSCRSRSPPRLTTQLPVMKI